MNTRTLAEVIPSVATSDGAGVKLRRSIGSRPGSYLDPFLMLDEFGTDNPEDYIAGFPSHPHRGFETVTYMLEGHMRHEDHLGNVGELTQGGVQWMTAGRGVIHSEMPLQAEGRMRGFQLWINLAAREKMKPASYRDFDAREIPVVTVNGADIRVIAGTARTPDGNVEGVISGLTTEPVFLDIRLRPEATIEQPLPADHAAFAYVYEGTVQVGPGKEGQPIPERAAGVLSSGASVHFEAGQQGASLILLAGKPLGESIVQYGPFVMNTREEIEQALRDYRDGTLTEGAPQAE